MQDQFLDGLKFAYPSVEFLSEKSFDPKIFLIHEDKEYSGMRIIPIRFAESIMGRPYKYHMKSKYEMYGLDWRIWKRNAMPKRNLEKESELKKILGIQGDEKYNFIATKYGSRGVYKASIKVNNEYKNIEMDFVDGYSLFDWCGVIEGATTIHAVSSSTLYLFEILNLKSKETHLYVRSKIEKDFSYVEFLFSKNYILHT